MGEVQAYRLILAVHTLIAFRLFGINVGNNSVGVCNLTLNIGNDGMAIWNITADGWNGDLSV